jgi:predicted amidohydrolase
MLMNRRTLLQGIGSLAALQAAPPKSTSSALPRKVIVGTSMQPFWVKHPGVEARLDELAAIVERMIVESKRKYGRGLDLAVLPEAAITGEVGRDALSQAVPFEGAVSRTFAKLAKENRCYIIVPTYLREASDPKACSNAAVLLNRVGEVAGTYRKVHLVVAADGRTMEGGSTPGNEVRAFDCDFGKLGIQIFYDMEFDRGWQELARQGAELIAWPTQSPQTAQPAARAMAQRCYIVSSTWRNNASIFEPTGKIIAQVKPPDQIAVQELDLSYAILPWSSKLRNGKALQERFGDKVGFRYYEDEDLGMFWSNDPKTSIRQMAQSLGLVETHEELSRVQDAYRRARVLDY